VTGAFQIGAGRSIYTREGDAAPGPITIQDGGTLTISDNTQNTGDSELFIAVPIVNDNGIVNAWTSLNADPRIGGTYSQSGALSELNMALGTYRFRSFTITAGEASLAGGRLQVNSGNPAEEAQALVDSAARFAACGTIEGKFVLWGSAQLTGDLICEYNDAFISGGTLDLNGYNFSLRGFNSTIFLNGAGAITGSGSVDAGLLHNSGGRIVVGGDGTPGLITLAANYFGGEDSSILVDVGGRLPWIQHDVFEIGGYAQLGGWLIPRLIDNYEPDPNDPFDVYTVVTYTSHNYEFENTFEEVSPGLYLGFNVGTTCVDLFPFTD
jgi:hypothetical protein